MSSQTYNSTFFVGRGQELNKVDEVIKIALETGKGRLLTIQGDPRSGKTWFLKAISDQQFARMDKKVQTSIAIWLDQQDFSTPELFAQTLNAKLQSYHTKRKKLKAPTIEINSDIVEITSDEKISAQNLRTFVKTFQVVPLIIIDDYHFIQEQYPLTDCWFLITFSKLLLEAGFVIIVSSRFSLENNSNRTPEQQVGPHNLPTVIHIQPFSVNDIETLIRKCQPKLKEVSAAAVRLYTWTGGHPGRCSDLLEAVVTEKSDNYLLELIDLALEKDFFADVLPPVILAERRMAIKLIETVSVLRIITVKILEELQVSQLVQAADGPAHTLINKLLQMELISYMPERGGYVIEDSLRMAFEKRLYCSNRQLWLQVHVQVYNLYQRWIGEYPYEPIAYLIEWFYHFLSITVFEKKVSLQFNKHLADLSQTIVFEDLGRNRLADTLATDNLLQMQVIANHVEVAYYQISQWIEGDKKGANPMKTTFFSEPYELVGEDRRNQLKNILDDLHDGASRLILITGNGGIGKTFMVKRVIERVKAPGMRDRFLIPDITDEDVDDGQVPQESGYGYVDFTDANLRDPFWLLSHIARGLRRCTGQENLFSGFDKQKNAYYDKGNILRLLVTGRVALQTVYATWVNEYNQFAQKSERTIFLCFDTTERIMDPQSAVIRFFFTENGIKRLENTKVLLAGRQDENIWKNHIIEGTKVALGNVTPYELKPLNKSDIQEYLNHIDVHSSEDDLNDYEFVSRGYPVILTVFARLPDVEKNKVIKEIEENAIARDVKRKTVTESSLTLQERENLLRLCFDEVSKKFITYQRNENADPMDLYQILFVARRGLTPELLAFLRGNPDDRNIALEDINEWYDSRSLLLKKIYKATGKIEEQDFMLVFHDVVYEHAVALDRYFTQRNHLEVLKSIVEFYRYQLARSEDNPAEINSRPEKYRSYVFDLLYYEYILNPWDALSLFAEKLDFAYRHYDLLMAKLLKEEWQRLKTDRAAQNFLGQIPPLPEEFFAWYSKLMQQRFLVDNPYSYNEGASLDVQDVSPDDPGQESGLKLYDVMIQEMDSSTYRLLPQIQKQLSLLKFRTELAWCAACIQEENFKEANELQRLIDTFDRLVSDFSLANHEDDSLLADTYYLRSQYWQIQQRWIWAIADLRQAIKIYHNHKAFLAESRCIADLIRLYLKYGMNNQANYIFYRSVHVAQEDGSDSLSHLFSISTRGNLHTAHGNYLHAEEIFNDLIYNQNENSEFNRLPSHDRSVLWRDGVRAKMQSMLLKLTLLDFIDCSQETWEKEQSEFETWVSQANSFADKNPTDQADLYLLRANFYLDILACRRLIPVITKNNNQEKIISLIDESLDTVIKVNEMSGIEQHLRLTDYYGAEVRLLFWQGELISAGNTIEKMLHYLKALPDQERDQRKPGQGFEFINLPDQQLEIYRLEATYQLLAGKKVLVDPSEESLVERKISIALAYFLHALQILANHPTPMLTMIAVEQIWQYLREAQPDQEKLCQIMRELLDDKPNGSFGWLLKSGFTTICPDGL